MWNWLRGTKARPEPAAPVPVASPPVPLPAHEADAGERGPALVAWLVDLPLGAGDAPLRPEEADALALVDTIAAAPRAGVELLPRVPAVVPQLLAALRHRDASVAALVERVSRDIGLAAEVLRMARTAGVSGTRPVHDLADAITAVGEQGLRAAIARVVLRPLLGDGGELARRAAPRLWDHGEHKARECARLAVEADLDAVDALLAGLLHNAGWTVALRALDRHAVPAAPWSPAFAGGLARRRDRLFGRIVGGWAASPAFATLAADALGAGLEASAQPLARSLVAADRAATAALVPAATATAH